ncbi:hypothetical protein ACMBCN_02935, partial [Candidatus Liberibacter asiaticus]
GTNEIPKKNLGLCPEPQAGGALPPATPQPTHREVRSAKNWVWIYSTFNNPSSDTVIINLC